MNFGTGLSNGHSLNRGDRVGADGPAKRLATARVDAQSSASLLDPVLQLEIAFAEGAGGFNPLKMSSEYAAFRPGSPQISRNSEKYNCSTRLRPDLKRAREFWNRSIKQACAEPWRSNQSGRPGKEAGAILSQSPRPRLSPKAMDRGAALNWINSRPRSAPPSNRIVMNRLIGPTLFILMAHGVYASQPCNLGQIPDADAAVRVLTRYAPSTKDGEERACIASAINVLSGLRSERGVPELIRHLEFRGEEPAEWGGALMRLHPYVEGEEYPAVLALARIGEPARPLLLSFIQSSHRSEIKRNNAAHALALSFTQEPGGDPGRAVLLIRRAELTAGQKERPQLESALEYILASRVCERSAPRCADAAHQKGAP